MSRTIHIGLPLFHVSLDDEGGIAALGVGAVAGGDRYRMLPGCFRKEVLVGGVDGAMASLVDRFEALAGPFSGNEDETSVFDLGSLVGRQDLLLARRGRFIRLKGRDGAEIRFGSESVIVLEVLAGLGNELAARTGDAALARAWKEIADHCEILPMEPENWFERVSEGKVLAEAEWYASRVGQDVGYYVAAAKWLRARQFLFAMKELPSEPTREEYDLSGRLDLPDPEEIESLVAAAAAGASQDVAEFVLDAVSDRNISARQDVVFRRWYGEDRRDSALSP